MSLESFGLILVGLGLIGLALGYSLCHAAALADLRAMKREAAHPKRATDPWEEPLVTVHGGVYDATKDGSGL